MKNQFKKVLYALSLFCAFALGAVTLSAFASAESAASELSVTTLDELLEAIECAEDGNTITIENTINIFQAMVIGDTEKAITLKRADTLTSSPMIIVQASENSNPVIFQNLVFDGAGVEASMEAIAIFQSTDFENVSFVNCISDSWSGAVHAQSGNISFLDCAFNDNKGRLSSHLFVSNSAAVQVYDSTFTRGLGISSGGAIRNNGEVYTNNCIFEDNVSGNGGAIYNMGRAIVSDSTLRNNESTNGGAIYNIIGICEISNSLITNNSARVGGGIFNASDLKSLDTQIYRNAAESGAADIYSTSTLALEVSSNDIFKQEGLTPLGWYADSFDDRFDGASNITQDYAMPLFNESGQLCLIFVFEEDIVSEDKDTLETPLPDDESLDEKGEQPDDDKPTDESENPVDNGNNGSSGNGSFGHTTQYNPVDIADNMKEDRNYSDINDSDLIDNDKIGVDKATLDKNAQAYLQGYEDALSDIESPITRGQMAKIIFRLLTSECREYYYCEAGAFEDIEDSPEKTAINTLANAGIVVGFQGKYRPEDYVTRAEVVTILSRFSNLESGTSGFADIAGHWAENHINICVSNNWISDGEAFLPNEVVSCTEILALINIVIQ